MLKKNYLRFLLVAAVVLSVAAFVMQAGFARPAGTFIAAGDDTWNTPNDGRTKDTLNVPAGFFGAGSLAYTGTVIFKSGDTTAPDTIIHRDQNVDTMNSPTTTLTFVKLALQGTAPITVSYSSGASERWNVASSISTTKPSGGSMTINDNGTFSSSLSVFPRFTFTRVSDGVQKVLDGAAPGIQAMLLAQLKEHEATNAVTPAPCKVVVDETNAAAGNCAPINLTGNGNWTCCPFRPQALTEADRLAAHGIFPPTPTPTPCRRSKDGVAIPCPIVVEGKEQ